MRSWLVHTAPPGAPEAGTGFCAEGWALGGAPASVLRLVELSLCPPLTPTGCRPPEQSLLRIDSQADQPAM